MADAEDGLLNITLSSSSSDSESHTPQKQPRDYQSPAAFAATKSSYLAKIEIGEVCLPALHLTPSSSLRIEKEWIINLRFSQVHKEITFPLTKPVTKHGYQRILHAIEELYFDRRFEEGRSLAERVGRELELEEGGGNEEWRQEVETYGVRCGRRAANGDAEGEGRERQRGKT